LARAVSTYLKYFFAYLGGFHSKGVIGVHSHLRIIKKREGRDAVGKAAYNSRSNLTNRYTGKTYYHRSRGGLLYQNILSPSDSPDWLTDLIQDREAFWSVVHQREIRKDAQLARELDIALLHELTVEQNIELLVLYVQREFVDKGMVADITIHAPPKGGDPRNIHAHILLTMREITPDGFGNKVRAWNHPSLASEWRGAWCKEANRSLEQNGFVPRLNHKSYKERAIEKEPTRYQGPAYRRQKQKSKDLDVPKGPIDVWKLLRATIDQKRDGRDSKGIEHEK
jgi:ATP-dependent exoDNAse (exonuclease V) alpha subunit